MNHVSIYSNIPVCILYKLDVRTLEDQQQLAMGIQVYETREEITKHILHVQFSLSLRVCLFSQSVSCLDGISIKIFLWLVYFLLFGLFKLSICSIRSISQELYSLTSRNVFFVCRKRNNFQRRVIRREILGIKSSLLVELFSRYTVQDNQVRL